MASLAMLLSLPAGEAFAATEVRLLNAVPGADSAELKLSGSDDLAELPAVGFGEATEYAGAPAGRVSATVIVDGRSFAELDELPQGVRTTIVATRRTSAGEGVALYEDGEAAPGTTRWRMVHAAPELDSAEFTLDDRVLGRLSRGEKTGYQTVEPGAHSIGARRPGDDEAIVERPDMSLVAGTAQTAYLVGSGGEATRFVGLEDPVAAPGTGPATGLGGLDRESGGRWLAALAAALLAAALGGAAHARGRGAPRSGGARR